MTIIRQVQRHRRVGMDASFIDGPDSRMTSQRTGLDSGGMISKLSCRKKKKKTKRKTYLVSKHTFVSLHPLFNWTIVFFVPYTFFLNLPKECN